jgi:hypothetical protein
VVDFNHETAQKIFRGLVKSHLLMFVSKKADNYDDIVATAAKLAATDDYRNKVNGAFKVLLHTCRITRFATITFDKRTTQKHKDKYIYESILYILSMYTYLAKARCHFTCKGQDDYPFTYKCTSR